MATYKGICKLTNKKETIWFDMISKKTMSNPNAITIGLMNNCSVCKRLGINVCEDCNLYKDLQHTNTR